MRALLAVQNYAENFSQNSPQFITPCPANEISKFHLRELLGLEGANKEFLESNSGLSDISEAAFWGTCVPHPGFRFLWFSSFPWFP